MSDLTEDLRQTADYLKGQGIGGGDQIMLRNAADELDRLRAENEVLRADLTSALGGRWTLAEVMKAHADALELKAWLEALSDDR